MVEHLPRVATMAQDISAHHSRSVPLNTLLVSVRITLEGMQALAEGPRSAVSPCRSLGQGTPVSYLSASLLSWIPAHVAARGAQHTKDNKLRLPELLQGKIQMEVPEHDARNGLTFYY